MIPLLLALAVAPAPGRVAPGDLSLYLAIAEQYGSGERSAALHEIRTWGAYEISKATGALREEEKRLRSEVKLPTEIAFSTVEAAILLHAEAGLLYLQQQRQPGGEASAPDVAAAAGRSNATIYCVTVRGRRDAREPFPDDVARAIGGRVFEASSERDVRARFLDVLEDLRARYVLRYTPRGPDAPGWHAVEVRVKKGRGDVRARPGYWRRPSSFAVRPRVLLS